MRPVLLIVVLLGLTACGIKGPPRPPLDEPASPLIDEPDAGCCGGKR